MPLTLASASVAMSYRSGGESDPKAPRVRPIPVGITRFNTRVIISAGLDKPFHGRSEIVRVSAG
jgi:hypothetical protein